MTPPAARKSPCEGWLLIGIEEQFTMWQKGHLCALSSVAYLHDEHQPPHWEWIVSFSNMGKARLSNEEIAICLKDFAAENFLEDNHEPGVARKFWMALEEQYRKPCPCQDEKVIVEGDYRYSVKKDSGDA